MVEVRGLFAGWPVPLPLLGERLVGGRPPLGFTGFGEPPATDLLGGQVAAPDLPLDGEPRGWRVGERGHFGGREGSAHAVTITGLHRGEQVATVLP